MKLILLLVFLCIIVNGRTQDATLHFRGRWLGYQGHQVSDWPGSSIEFNISGSKSVSLKLGEYPPPKISCSSSVGVRYFLNVWINGTNVGKIDVKNA